MLLLSIMYLTKKLIAIVFLLFSFVFLPPVTFAQQPQQMAAPQQPKEVPMKGKVLKILEEGERDVQGKKYPYQNVSVQVLDGPEKGKMLAIQHGEVTTLRPEQKVTVGEIVVVVKLSSPELTMYQIVDKYRLDVLIYITIAFFILIIALNRWKGLGSFLGLGVSLAVIMLFIVPQILAGQDAFWTIIIGAIIIMVTSMYLAHGFIKTTHIAMLATVIALLTVGLLAVLFVEIAKITGLGNDDAYALQFNRASDINFKGLLLGGIIIGALGVLDDVTTGLAAAMNELVKANPKFTYGELVKSGIRIGSEHIASLVNTLVLAYASVGLPIFLFIILNPTNQPLWVMINSEMVSEEIVRTLAGSIGIVLAVPITTIIAAWLLTTKLPEATPSLVQKPKVKRFRSTKK